MYKEKHYEQQDSVEVETGMNLQAFLAVLGLGLTASMEHRAIGMLGWGLGNRKDRRYRIGPPRALATVG